MKNAFDLATDIEQAQNRAQVLLQCAYGWIQDRDAAPEMQLTAFVLSDLCDMLTAAARDAYALAKQDGETIDR